MTIRDESIKALEVALWGLNLDPPNVHRIARESFAASPTLATDLDFATAWRMAVGALPEGWVFEGVYRTESGRWYAFACGTDTGGSSIPAVDAHGPTPTEALVALTAALRERAR